MASDSNTLLLFNNLYELVLIKRDFILDAIDHQKGVISRNAIKDYINEISNIVIHEKNKFENNSDITPTTANSSDNNINNNNQNLINLRETQSVSQLSEIKQNFSQLSNEEKLDEYIFCIRF